MESILRRELRIMKKSNWLCFGTPMTDEAPIRVVRVSRLPTFRTPPQTQPPLRPCLAAESPRFDDRKGVEKKFGMAKWRKSQKILREKKQGQGSERDFDYEPKEPVFQERAVDVPSDFHRRLQSTLTKENNRENSRDYRRDERQVENQKPNVSKSCTNTPNMSRARNRSGRFQRSNKNAQSLPSRRIKNFVPYDA